MDLLARLVNRVFIRRTSDGANINPATEETASAIKTAVEVCSDGVTTSEAVSNTAVTLLSADATRCGGILYNSGAGVARITLGSTAPTSSIGIPLAPGDYMPFQFSGQIRAIRQDSTDTIIEVQEITK